MLRPQPRAGVGVDAGWDFLFSGVRSSAITFLPDSQTRRGPWETRLGISGEEVEDNADGWNRSFK